jgi:hypothetical protein
VTCWSPSASAKWKRCAYSATNSEPTLIQAGHSARWLRAYIEHVSAKHGLAAAFATGRREDSELIAACQAAVEAIGTSLLQRAKDDGPVRIDINLPDVITLVNAIAMAAEATDDPGADRLLAIVLAGITQPGRGGTNPQTKARRR